jgi:hypothetical protein
MSNSILTPACKLDIKSSPKLVLISLADQANDDGWCICGIHHLMNRTGLSERAVQMQLNYLEDIGAVTRHRRRHQVTVYRVTPEAANCPRIVKIQRTVDPFDTIGSGAPTSTKTRPAKYAGLEKKTRKSCAPDPQNMRPDPAPDAPLPVLTIHTNPQPGESGEWGVLVEIWPKKGNIEEARPLFEALSLDDQERIVDGLGLQATHRHPVPPQIGRIEFLNPGISIPTPHGVGLGEEQTADEPLGGPTIHMDELPGEVVEQFRMGGAFSERAEVVHRAHEAASEEVVPDRKSVV